MITTYTLNMIDSEEQASWMSLPGVDATPGTQGVALVGDREVGVCAWTVTTTGDHEALEAALNADDDVLRYEYVETLCDEHEDCRANEELAVACAESR